jgi:hypothetical protein
VVIATQLQNYRNFCSTTKQGDVQRTPYKGRILRIIRPCHYALEKVKMTTNYLVRSLTRLATFISAKSMFGARNRTLLDPTSLNNSGIQIHGQFIPQFFTTINDGV